MVQYIIIETLNQILIRTSEFWKAELDDPLSLMLWFLVLRMTHALACCEGTRILDILIEPLLVNLCY